MSVHTDAKKATRKSVIFKKTLRFFGLTRRVKNYPTNEIGAFAHVSGAAEVTVKHNLGGRSNTKQSCRAHIRNEDIRQVASTLPGRNKKTKKMQGKMKLLVLEISMFSLYDFDKRVNTCSLLLSDKRVSEA